MASVIPSGLRQASIERSIRKAAKVCQECGKMPIPYEVDLPSWQKTWGIGCPDRHGLIQCESFNPIDGDIAAHYRNMLNQINPVIDAWNDQQDEKRTAKMFPGKPHAPTP